MCRTTPQNSVCCSNTSCKDVSHIEGTKDLYCCIVNALHCAALNVIPVTRANCRPTADDHNIPGWNDLIKAAHSDARDAFKFWVASSKPRQGEEFDSMRFSRAKFKYMLRKCRREEATIRADILASDLSSKRNLKGLDAYKSVFVNDDLTTMRSKLLYELKRDGSVTRVWTMNGKIMCIQEENGKEVKKTIDSPDDLFKVGWSEEKVAGLGFYTTQ